ncbi:hypothetical protein [Streptomyces sp. NPDC101165]|uniref:hypothetical protein n=1 Tax=Streptomyces sp. NPDC101165 TaxID=3366119 RepID=UPI003830FA57
MRASRSLAALIGVASLGIALTACQDQAAGTVVAHTGARYVETFTNPSIRGCHPFREGVTNVKNYTLSSMLLYTTPNCTVPPGGSSIYVDMQSSDQVVPSYGLWRSFSFTPQ